MSAKATSRCCAAVALLALSCSQTAERPRPRTGLYANVAVGHVYGVGRASRGRSTLTASGQGAEVRAAAGHSVAEGLALAAEGRALAHNGRNGDDTFGPGLTALGVLIDWHPDPTHPAHLQLGLNRMRASIVASSAGQGGDFEPGDGRRLDGIRGVFGHAGAGWSWRSVDGFAFTPMLEVYRARGTNDATSLDLWGTTLDLMVTWF